ncbi:DNA_binding HTH domain [Hexamita inflata]|uniref:Psq-type n=1 Tax=Hexamita inflata TaxID=28002 RepID=A0AA86RAD0_9EUKA|nr:DNA binding HTH domain [Hexamita inflata]
MNCMSNSIQDLFEPTNALAGSRKVVPQDKIQCAIQLIQTKSVSIRQAAQQFNLSKSTLHRAMAKLQKTPKASASVSSSADASANFESNLNNFELDYPFQSCFELFE